MFWNSGVFFTETGALFARRIFGDVDLYLSALHEGRGAGWKRFVFFMVPIPWDYNIHHYDPLNKTLIRPYFLGEDGILSGWAL